MRACYQPTHQRARRAVGADEGTQIGDLVAPVKGTPVGTPLLHSDPSAATRQHLAVQCAGGVEAFDARIGQRSQFAGLRYPILVQVLPHFEPRPVDVTGIHFAVAVAVFLRQGGKAVGCAAACHLEEVLVLGEQKRMEGKASRLKVSVRVAMPVNERVLWSCCLAKYAAAFLKYPAPL